MKVSDALFTITRDVQDLWSNTGAAGLFENVNSDYLTLKMMMFHHVYASLKMVLLVRTNDMS